jgi:hypothetical protein
MGWDPNALVIVIPNSLAFPKVDTGGDGDLDPFYVRDKYLLELLPDKQREFTKKLGMPVNLVISFAAHNGFSSTRESASYSIGTWGIIPEPPEWMLE